MMDKDLLYQIILDENLYSEEEKAVMRELLEMAHVEDTPAEDYAKVNEAVGTLCYLICQAEEEKTWALSVLGISREDFNRTFMHN